MTDYLDTRSYKLHRWMCDHSFLGLTGYGWILVFAMADLVITFGLTVGVILQRLHP